MEAYEDLMIRDVLVEQHGLTPELATDLVRRNRLQRWRQEKELRSILEAWGFGPSRRA
jgi:hypothetical protein